MTPQSYVLVIAPIRKEREPELRHLRQSMNLGPGDVNSVIDLIPYHEFAQIHFARFMILDDQTTGDLQTPYGIQSSSFQLYLSLLADFDRPANLFRADLAVRARAGLERIYEWTQKSDPLIGNRELSKGCPFAARDPGTQVSWCVVRVVDRNQKRRSCCD